MEVRCEIFDKSVTIIVRDQGIGVKQEDKEKLFERFYLPYSNNTISGFGIGLYLSAEIIERHDGEI
ncbi:sensor histidine kinase [Pedobacter sp. MC2016-24]|nr:sensor histidine kinase [Pedobacter sp. MC2016-24]